MSKIVSMSSGAIDPIAQSKRVFFRPAAADTVRVGDLVCYNWDIERDHKERASDPTHIGLTQHTYAEGAQDFTGRLFIVEKPATANLEFFAGVVKALGPKAGADDDMIEIWVPNGAVLPVMVDQACVAGRTIVGVRDGAYEGSYPGRPIGIAMEDQDGDAGDDLCWVKVDPNMFAWQYGSAGVQTSLLIDDECGTGFTLNQIKVETAHTAGKLTGLKVRIVPTGAGTATAVNFELAVQGTIATTLRVVDVVLWLESTATWQATYADGTCALRICIGSSAPHPNMAGLGLSGISFQNYLVETSGAPEFLYPFLFHCGAGCQWDGLFKCDAAGLGIEAQAADTSTQTWGTDDITIPILVGTTTYYIYASVAATAA